MADRTEGTITIDADPARVMSVIADFTAYPEWSGEIKKVEVRDPGDGRARDVYFEMSAGPISAKYTLRYDYEGDHRVSWESVEASGLRSIEGEYLLEPQGGGTKVTYRAAVELGIPMLGFMKRQGEKRVIDTALKGLKKRVESLS